jgi:hypothetical protein
VGTGKKLHTFAGGRKGVAKFKGHTGHVLALAMSDDGRYLVCALFAMTCPLLDLDSPCDEHLG